MANCKVLPIENRMKKPHHFSGCPGILNISMAIVIVLYIVIGFFGYVKYGEKTEGSITLNLPIEDIPAQAVKVLIAIAIVCTYGLQMYVPTLIAWGGLKECVNSRWESVVETCFRLAVVAVSVGLAAAVPNLGPIISLVGAVCFTTLGLLCPAIIETVACWDNGLGVACWRLYKNIVIVLLALCAIMTGSYVSILEIIEAYG